MNLSLSPRLSPLIAPRFVNLSKEGVKLFPVKSLLGQSMRKRTVLHGYALLLAALAGLYALSNGLQARPWDTSNRLDGSYWFAFTKLLSVDKFFGRDVFFTYGPLAQYLGPVMPSEGLGHGPAVYLISLWLAGSLFFCTYHLLHHVMKEQWSVLLSGTIYTFLIPAFEAFPNDRWFIFLVAFLSLSTCLAQDRRKTQAHMILLLSLAIIAIHYKFSSGLLAAAVFILAAVFLHRHVGMRFALGMVFLFVICSYLTFWLLTGSLGLHTYLYAGLIVSEAHSEIMIFHVPLSEAGLSGYISGIIYALSILGTILLVVLTALRKQPAKGFYLIVSILTTVFLAYKHSFIRNDWAHNLYLYQSLFPFGVLITGVALGVAGSRIWTIVPTIALVTSFLWISNSEYVLHNSSLWDAMIVPAAKTWTSMPTKLWRGVIGIPPDNFEQENVNKLRSDHPRLFDLLDTLCSQNAGKETTITFYPWETMYVAAVRGCKWQPMPSLQIYAEGPNRYSHMLDAKMLLSENAPDIIVLSKERLDWRNSVSEFTNWLEPLFTAYRPVATEDNMTVLIKTHPGSSLGSILCRDNGPGLFLHGKVQPLTPLQALVFKLGTAVFKAPELTSSILYIDGKGKLRVIYSRSYYSQLARGVYFSAYPVGTLLTNAQADEDARAATEVVKVISASLIRNPGTHNLPIIGAVTPIQVEYCAPERYQYASRLDERIAGTGDLPDTLSLPLIYTRQITSSLEGSSTVHSLTGTEPELRFGLGLPAKMVRELRIKMNLLPVQDWGEGDLVASLYFVLSGQFEPTENQRLDFVVKADGRDHTYKLKTSGLEAWQGVIAEVRIIPVRDLTPSLYPKIKGTRLDVEAKLDLSPFALY